MSASVSQLVAFALFSGTLLISFGLWCQIGWQILTGSRDESLEIDTAPPLVTEELSTAAAAEAPFITAAMSGEPSAFDSPTMSRTTNDAAPQRGTSLFPWEPDRATNWPLIGTLATAALAIFYLASVVFTLLTALGVVPEKKAAQPVASEIAAEVPGDVAEAEPAKEPGVVSVQMLQKQSVLVLTVSLILFLALATSPTIPLKHLGFSLQNVPRQIGDGLIGFLLAIGPVMICMIGISPFRTVENTHPFLQALVDDGSAELWFWVTFTAVIGAAVSEELFFRIALQGLLETRISAPLAIGTSTLLFCSVHGFPDMLALVPLALILGYMFHRRRSYLSVAVTHAVFNGFMLLMTALATNSPPSTFY